MYRIGLVVISLLMFMGCQKGDESTKQSKIDPDLSSRFEEVYAAWKLKDKEFMRFAKTTPIKEYPEYKNFLPLGSESVPMLREKVLAHHGFDFVLCDVIIDLEGWSPYEFTMLDYGMRARQVLSKLDGQSINKTVASACP